jgi:hypothetical protein
MVVAVVVGAGITTMVVKVPHSTAFRKRICTDSFVGSLSRTINICVCVSEVPCRSVLTQVVLSVVLFDTSEQQASQRITSWEAPLLYRA